MSDLIGKIRSRGYWEVVIRPSRYDKKKIEDITDLFPLIEKLVVRLRGWDFPHIDYKKHHHIDLDWVGQEFEWQHHKSSWRFYQSGQFAHISSISLDWRDESSLWPADDSWEPGALLGVGDTISTFSEITEFASRLSLSEAGDELMDLRINIGGLNGRTLYIDSHSSRWPFDNTYTASIEMFPIKASLGKDELVARSSEIATRYAGELFKRFGWNTTPELIRDWLEKRG